MLKAIKNKVIRLLVIFGLWLYCRFLYLFPFLLERFIAFAAYWIAYGERKTAVRQVRESLKGYTGERAKKLVRAMTAHLAKSLIEALELYRGNPAVLDKVRFAPGSLEKLRTAIDGGVGVVYATGHIGNWELMAARIVEAGIPANTFYKRSYDEGLDRLVRRFRARYGIGLIDRNDENMSHKLRGIFSKGELVGVLMDQDTDLPGIFVDFLGKPAYTPSGAAGLAVTNGAPLLVGWIHRSGSGHELRVEGPFQADPDADPKDEIRRLTLLSTGILEKAILAEPEQWVWFHERWKTARKD